MPKIEKNSNELQGKRRRRLRGPRFRNLLPIQELRLGRRTKRPSKEKVPRKRRERKRFTNKQKPILHLFLLNAHWRRSRYKLDKDKRRLSGHIFAFKSYYGLEDSFIKRTVQSKISKPNRTVELFNSFESRLDVTLVRLGWAPNLVTARDWSTKGKVVVHRDFGSLKNYPLPANPGTVLVPGDRIRTHGREEISFNMRCRYKKVRWRAATRSLYPTKKPRGFDRKAFSRYKWSKRYRPWSRFMRYFLYHPPSFIVNYNLLSAVYRPTPTTMPIAMRYPSHFGGGFFFWQELFDAYRRR